MLTLFGLIMLWHLLYDFHWQGDFIGIYKAKYNFLLGVHSLTWTLGLIGILSFFGLATWGKFFFLFATHYLIDMWKCRYSTEHERLTYNLWIDQALHIITMLAVMFPWLV